jgi:hypothetical protein
MAALRPEFNRPEIARPLDGETNQPGSPYFRPYRNKQVSPLASAISNKASIVSSRAKPRDLASTLKGWNRWKIGRDGGRKDREGTASAAPMR